jgi:Uma2 family endonuclease
MAATAERVVSTEEFLTVLKSAPEDVELELIEGQIREFPMTTRSPQHSVAISRISYVLLRWLEAHPDRPGVVAGGEARCRITRDPDTTVGLDVAYFEGVEFVEQAKGAKFFDGPPIVAIEVLSPSDEHEDVVERVRNFLSAGVAQVWVADPDFQTVTVHRPDAEQQFFTAHRELDGGLELPGLRCVVESLFVGTHKALSG